MDWRLEMAENDETMFRDLYARMNETDKNLSNLVGQTTVIAEQNKQLIGLLKFVIKFMGFIILVLVGALIYGALGSEGFNAVKNMPNPMVAYCTPISNVCGSHDLEAFLLSRS